MKSQLEQILVNNLKITNLSSIHIDSFIEFLKLYKIENNNKRCLVDQYHFDSDELKNKIVEIKNCSNDFILVVENENKVIGVLDFYDSSEDFDNVPLVELGITILKEYQNQGIGKNLIKEAIYKAKSETSIKTILISVNGKNRVALCLYEKLGFVISETFSFENKFGHEMKLNI